MASIQFRGIAQVIRAFEDRGADAWSIWDGKAFLFRGVGAPEFETLLRSLDTSGSTAIYTLKVYDDIDNAKKIKPSTECDGSFNFRLYDRDIEESYRPGQSWTQTKQLEERFTALEQRMNQFLEQTEIVDEEEEEKPTDLLGVVTGLLQQPEKLEKLIEVGHRLLGGSMQPAYLGNVNRIVAPNEPIQQNNNPSLSPSNNIPVVETEEQKEKKLIRLGTALDTLEKADPSIVDHLEKLAVIAATKPEQFKGLIGMLDLYA